MDSTRRSLFLAVPMLAASAVFAADSQPLSSFIKPYGQLPVKSNGKNTFRPILDGVTHSGDHLEVHETTLAPRFNQREPLGLFRCRCVPGHDFSTRLDLQSLYVAFHSLGKITHQMVAIGNLDCRCSRLPSGCGIEPAAVTRDDFYFRMQPQPLSKALSRAVGQQVDDLPLLHVHKHRAIAQTLAPCPIVYAEHSHLSLRPH